MAKCAGTITPAVDSPDRTRKPIMNSNLAIRSFFRFIELRHTAADDLKPSDFSGRCGSGAKVLLRKCRDNEVELRRALETRVDDIIRMIRAFSDLTAMIRKFQPFFRSIIEVAIPALLQRRHEPLPRMISFLEPYGDIQLDFLYQAAQEGMFHRRFAELDSSQLLETTAGWMRKARDGTIAIIMANKVRGLVLKVALLDFQLSPQQQTEWFAATVWASTLEMSPLVQRLEVRIRDGLADRGDPGELFGVAALLTAEGIDSAELFKLVASRMRKAFAENIPRAADALLDVESRPATPYPGILVNTLKEVAAHFTAGAPGELLEHVLSTWQQRKFALTDVCQVMAQALLERTKAGLLSLGSSARSGSHLSTLGVSSDVLASLVSWLLGGEHAGSCSEGRALDLLSQLWPASDDAPPPRVSEADAVLRLVGVAQTPVREADIAAEALGRKLALELPSCSADAEAAIREWREHFDAPLSATVAPFILQEVRSGALDANSEAGDLGRSAVLLTQALSGEPLLIRTAEWVLGPFAGAGPTEVDFTLEAVAKACGKAEFPTVLEDAGRLWLADGSPPAKLGFRVIQAALAVWEREGVRGAGLETLRKVFAWLQEQADPRSKEVPNSLKTGLDAAVQHLVTLLEAIDGTPPTLADLARAKEGALAGLGINGRNALTDAVAITWSAAVPGLSPASAALHFEMWWDGQYSNRGLVECVVSEAIEELRWKSDLRIQCTFGSPLPPGMQGPPAWRVEGLQRVPWFVSEELAEAAYSGDDDDELRFPLSDKTVRRGDSVRMAKEITGGRCMYCGSNHEISGRYVWPLELGGTKLGSNMGAVCPVCAGFLERVGPRRWGEAIDIDPKDAADVWWKAQKKANMKVANFLRD